MHKNSNNISTRMIALEGVFIAMSLLFLYLASFVPGKLSLYAISSFFVSVLILEFGPKAGWLHYIAVGLLALLLPNKLAVLPYVMFFGYYGIAKFYIEKLRNLFLEYVIKIAYFSAFLWIASMLFMSLLPVKLEGAPWIAIIVILEVLFVVYDYIYSMFIQYYNHRIRRIVGKKF